MDKITRNPKQMNGAPCIRGLRIPVKTIVMCLASGMSRDDVLRDYPDLESEDLTAALRYAAAAIDSDPTPGFPQPPGDERIEDLVNVDGMGPDEADTIRAAARSALEQRIEPGIRRARYIEGWIDGYRAGRREHAGEGHGS